jgi:hypothetical protein
MRRMETSPLYFPCEVPAGRSGRWVIEKVAVPERDYDPDGDPRPEPFKFRPGVYTSLRRDSVQFMTDLYDEWWTQRRALTEAVARGGEVLITGLGLGLVAEAMLRAPGRAVERITILEQSADVIRLVQPSLHARHPGRVEVVEADAFSWDPAEGRRFTVVWHDIWPDPYLPEVEVEIARLEARYQPCCDWQGSWPREYLRALAGD